MSCSQAEKEISGIVIEEVIADGAFLLILFDRLMSGLNVSYLYEAIY